MMKNVSTKDLIYKRFSGGLGVKVVIQMCEQSVQKMQMVRLLRFVMVLVRRSVGLTRACVAGLIRLSTALP